LEKKSGKPIHELLATACRRPAGCGMPGPGIAAVPHKDRAHRRGARQPSALVQPLAPAATSNSQLVSGEKNLRSCGTRNRSPETRSVTHTGGCGREFEPLDLWVGEEKEQEL
jgi:hypothetical protein